MFFLKMFNSEMTILIKIVVFPDSMVKIVNYICITKKNVLELIAARQRNFNRLTMKGNDHE